MKKTDAAKTAEEFLTDLLQTMEIDIDEFRPGELALIAARDAEVERAARKDERAKVIEGCLGIVENAKDVFPPSPRNNALLYLHLEVQFRALAEGEGP